MAFSILTNPVVFSVVILCALCMLNVNVLLALLIAAMAAASIGRIPLPTAMAILTDGFRINGNSALADLLLGTFAAAIAYTGLSDIVAQKISKTIGKNKTVLLFSLTIIACFSQNIIPVHIAFIPIIIPPLLQIFNRLKLDRRSAACALIFGLKVPCITVPFGFGSVFMELIAINMTENDVPTEISDIVACNWILGIPMLLGLFISALVTYKKPRVYKDQNTQLTTQESQFYTFGKKHLITCLAILLVVVVQAMTENLSLASLSGLVVIFFFGAIKRDSMDDQFADGVQMMGMISFTMLAAGGYSAVLKATNTVDELVNLVITLIQGNKLIAAITMNLIGVVITIGIGSSFSAIPVISVLYVPLCKQMGFSKAATIMLISAAVTIGGVSSPASDVTLGSTAGLNADNQHRHITDTCIPAFLHLSIPLLAFSVIFSSVV